MAEPAAEVLLTDFLSAYAQVDRRMAEKRRELMGQPKWSDVTSRLEASEFNARLPSRYLALSACVDGELSGVGGVAWQVEAKRSGIGWEVERIVTLTPVDPLRGQYDTARLPFVTFANTREFVPAFAGLIDELLAVPAPRPE